MLFVSLILKPSQPTPQVLASRCTSMTISRMISAGQTDCHGLQSSWTVRIKCCIWRTQAKLHLPKGLSHRRECLCKAQLCAWQYYSLFLCAVWSVWQKLFFCLVMLRHRQDLLIWPFSAAIQLGHRVISVQWWKSSTTSKWNPCTTVLNDHLFTLKWIRSIYFKSFSSAALNANERNEFTFMTVAILQAGRRRSS